MLYFIEAENTTLISSESHDSSFWSSKLYGFKRLMPFGTLDECIQHFTKAEPLFEQSCIAQIQKIDFTAAKHYRYAKNDKNKPLISPVYLSFIHLKGMLIYWWDWRFTLEKIDDDYFLWYAIEGRDEENVEFKLSAEQVHHFKTRGYAYIDELVNSLS